jgi:hypothetical protein
VVQGLYLISGRQVIGTLIEGVVQLSRIQRDSTGRMVKAASGGELRCGSSV